MRGLFIPDITAEMFKNGCLESIEALMAEGEIYDIEYSPWIPVSERLPEVMYGSNGECSDDVLICVIDDENITISTGFYGYYPNSNSEQGWWSVWAYGCHKLDSKYKVVAWMPLPQPYVESEDKG